MRPSASASRRVDPCAIRTRSFLIWGRQTIYPITIMTNGRIGVISAAEAMMKLVRFNGGKTGLVVELPSGPHVIDVVGSLGALSPDDPISQGVLNGILKDRGSWAPLIEHWRYARSGLRRLALLARANPEAPRLVICPIDEARLALPSADPNSIATPLDIAELGALAQGPDRTRSDGAASPKRAICFRSGRPPGRPACRRARCSANAALTRPFLAGGQAISAANACVGHRSAPSSTGGIPSFP